MKKLYVGNLPYSVNEEKLEELFSAFGEVSSVVVIKDRETKRSKGFGFVEFANDDEADKAMTEMNEAEVDGRNLKVNEARPQEKKF